MALVDTSTRHKYTRILYTTVVGVPVWWYEWCDALWGSSSSQLDTQCCTLVACVCACMCVSVCGERDSMYVCMYVRMCVEKDSVCVCIWNFSIATGETQTGKSGGEDVHVATEIPLLKMWINMTLAMQTLPTVYFQKANPVQWSAATSPMHHK